MIDFEVSIYTLVAVASIRAKDRLEAFDKAREDLIAQGIDPKTAHISVVSAEKFDPFADNSPPG